MTISISDLSPATSDCLVAAINEEEGGVIKSAVARALEARKIMGGISAAKVVDPIKVKEPVIVGKVASPTPITVGIIALPPCPPPITVGIIAIDPLRATV